MHYDYRRDGDSPAAGEFDADRATVWDDDVPLFTAERYPNTSRWIIIEIHEGGWAEPEISSDPNGDLLLFRDLDVATEHYRLVTTEKRP